MQCNNSLNSWTTIINPTGMQAYTWYAIWKKLGTSKWNLAQLYHTQRFYRCWLSQLSRYQMEHQQIHLIFRHIGYILVSAKKKRQFSPPSAKWNILIPLYLQIHTNRQHCYKLCTYQNNIVDMFTKVLQKPLYIQLWQIFSIS